MDLAGSPDDADLYRRESLGAFAHDIRTPLTSVKMVLDLATRGSRGESLTLDPELVAMLKQSVDDIEALTEQLHELSWMERGRFPFHTVTCDLSAAVEVAKAQLLPALVLEGAVPASVSGEWDPGQLSGAIAGFARSANRMGDGSGHVPLATTGSASAVELVFASGVPSGALRPVAPDAGFAFFRARQAVLLMGGSVVLERGESWARIGVALPR